MRSRLFYRVWVLWEWVFEILWRVKPIASEETCLFKVARSRYLGHPFVVDGVSVRRFDPVIEIHMNNELLLHILNETKSVVGLAVRLLKETQSSLPALAKYVADAKYTKSDVLLGVTFIHRGVERFGFHVFPIHRSLVRKLTTLHLRNVFRMVNPSADNRLMVHPDDFIPKVVAMSKRHLLQHFGTDPDPHDKVLV